MVANMALNNFQVFNLVGLLVYIGFVANESAEEVLAIETPSF